MPETTHGHEDDRTKTDHDVNGDGSEKTGNAGVGSDPVPTWSGDEHEGGGRTAGEATDVTPEDVAEKRGFHGDAVAPAGNPAADPIGTEGEPEQPAGSTHNEADPESKMETDPEPRDPEAPLPHHSARIDAPDADAATDEPLNGTPSRDTGTAGREGRP
ncbi:hypothetical protein [Paramicrobacterium agarici]|uniref:Uncharacterized protein n=1 Tax=Paramicrobacterium agarici TaxID=630514 RepID=A0A2A9DSX2_9MICO|nr:hypothetical protein [Microbacterium agarici]PFG29788.1 hypothetical protein ATJ78_0703 [Microbacterium agarici]